MRKYFFITLTLVATILTSCTKSDYTSAIPGNSTALVAINAMDFTSAGSPFASLLTPFVDKESKELKGIDLTKDIYLFESGDGSLGMCAPVSDVNTLDDFMDRLKNIGALGEFTELDEGIFCTLNKSWVIGYNDDLMLVMGPVTGADAEKQMMKRMNRMMKQDADHDIKNSDLWKHLAEIKAPMKMVARADALPEQMVASVTLGSPKGTNPSDVLVEGSMEYADGTLYLNGSTSSFNPNVEQALKKAASIYKPLTINWQKQMKDSIFAGVFMNVDGEKFLPFIQCNRALSTMLMGSDAYDKIRINKGNIGILITTNAATDTLATQDPTKPTPDYTQKVDDTNFSAQVYNLPPGNTKTQDRLVVCLNLQALTGSKAESIAPFLGKIHRIVYRLK